MPRPLSSDGLFWRESKGWCARVLVTIDGVRVRKVVDLGTRDRVVARRKRRELLAGNATAESVAKPETVARYADAWLDGREARGVRIAPDERRWFDHYWREAIGNLSIDNVRPHHVQSVLSDCATGKLRGPTGKRLKRASIEAVRGVLLRILDTAWRTELIRENPVARVKLADVVGRNEARRERAILTDAEINALLVHPAVHVEMKMLVLLARTIGGMRAGDLNALQWTAVDLESFAVVRVPRRKTRKPQPLEVPEAVRPYLERWWREQSKPTDGAVFPVRRGARAGETKSQRSSSGYAKRLRRDLKRALGVAIFDHTLGERGRWAERPVETWTQRERLLFIGTHEIAPVDFHSCRRAFATALARANVNTQTAQVLTGHSDPRVHQRYVAAETIRALPVAALPAIEVDPARAWQTFLPNSALKRRQLCGRDCDQFEPFPSSPSNSLCSRTSLSSTNRLPPKPRSCAASA